MSQENGGFEGSLKPLVQRRNSLFDLRSVSFGSPAAIVTSMALIVGLDAVTATKLKLSAHF